LNASEENAMATTGPPERRAALAICGVVAPLVYIAAVLAASRESPGFDHLDNFISELGATGAPGAALMNFVGFLPYGMLMLAFALAVHRGIRPDIGGWLGPSALGLYGLAYMALALSRCDPGCQGATPSLHHRIHFLLSDVILLAAVLAPFTLYARMVKDPGWRPLAAATLVLPGTAWLTLELSGVGMSGALRQRLWLLLLFTWIELVAIRLLKLGADGSRTAVPTPAGRRQARVAP
jgi:hypothetical protein